MPIDRAFSFRKHRNQVEGIVRPSWQSKGLVAWFPWLVSMRDGNLVSKVGNRVLSTSGVPTKRKNTVGDIWRCATSGPDYFYSGAVIATPPMTITGWFFPEEDSQSTYRCVYAHARTDGNRWALVEIESDAAGGRLDLRMFNGAFANVTSTKRVIKNQWNFFVAVLETSTSKIYLNEEAGNQVSHSNTTDLNGYSIGAFRYGSTTSDTYLGGIGDYRIYNFAFTPDLARALYDPRTRFDLYRKDEPTMTMGFVPPVRAWRSMRTRTVNSGVSRAA